jgi:uncharacterized protein with PIN domain
MLPQRSETDKPTAEVRLLADAMLGKLAKWLRLLGYDTTYDPAWDDATIVRLARAEGRVILTRDRALSERRGVQALLLASDELQQQMAQILQALHLPTDRAGSRCSVCNAELEPVARRDVRDRVPPHVWKTQEVFHHCPRCDRIYWRGGHWARMQPVLSKLVETEHSEHGSESSVQDTECAGHDAGQDDKKRSGLDG